MMFRSAIRWAIVACAFATILLAGCTATPTPASLPSDRGSGTLQVLALVPQDTESAFVESEYEFELILSQENQTRTVARPMETAELALSVDELFTGIWSVKIHLRDHEDAITHAASGDVIILPEETTAAQFHLKPEPGELHAVIDLSKIADPALRAKIEGARVYVNPGGYSSGTRDPDTGDIEITRILEPQSYDFQIVLYTDGYLAGNRAYSSPWMPIDIAPGKVTQISWSPSVGDLDLRGFILDAPQPPAALQAAVTSDAHIRLTWQAPTFPAAATETGIRIYERGGIFDAFFVVHELSGEATSWEFPLPPGDKPLHLAYAVTAFAKYPAEPDVVYESSRSVAYELFIPSNESDESVPGPENV